MRTLDSGAVALLAGRKPIIAGAMRAVFGSGTYRLWSGEFPLDGTIIGDAGQTFTAIKDRALITPYASQLGGAADSLVISLSGIDPDIAQTIEAEDYQQKPVTIWRLVFADPNTLLSAMVMMRGKCDFVTQRETVGGKCTLDFSIEGPRRDMNRAGSRIVSDADQRVLGGATDGACKHISVAGKKTLYWGNKPGNATSGGISTGNFTLDYVRNRLRGIIG